MVYLVTFDQKQYASALERRDSSLVYVEAKRQPSKADILTAIVKDYADIKVNSIRVTAKARFNADEMRQQGARLYRLD